MHTNSDSILSISSSEDYQAVFSNMTYRLSDSSFHSSPSRSDRRSRQARPQQLPPPKTADGSPAAKYQTSSLHLPKGLSLNLFSLINKFETLDVLGLPLNVKTAQPAPPQTQQNSTKKRGGIGTTQQKRLSTVFSPENRSQENYGDVFLEDEYVRQQESFRKPSAAVLSSPVKETPASGSQHKDSTPLHAQQYTIARGPFQSRGSGTLTSPYIQNDIPPKRKHTSIRDMISVYDGGRSLLLINTLPLVAISADVLYSNVEWHQYYGEAVARGNALYPYIRTNHQQIILRCLNKEFKSQVPPQEEQRINYIQKKHSPLSASNRRNMIFGRTTPSRKFPVKVF